MRTALLLALLLPALSACSDARRPVGATVSVAEAMSGDTTGYDRAEVVREFVFPQDHGPHPGFKAEWWYVTGNVRATDGTDRRFGIQFTVFRSALSPDTVASGRASGWAADQLYMAHVAVGDVFGERFYEQERFARGAAGSILGPEANWLRAASTSEAPTPRSAEASSHEIRSKLRYAVGL